MLNNHCHRVTAQLQLNKYYYYYYYYIEARGFIQWLADADIIPGVLIIMTLQLPHIHGVQRDNFTLFYYTNNFL
jgi:hypothetical protein